MQGNRFDKAAYETVKRERSALEKKIISDLKDMMAEAYCVIIESKLLQEFTNRLNGKTPTKSQIIELRSEVESAISEKNPKFSQYFNLVLDRDRKNPVMLEVGIEVKSDIFG